MESGSEIWHSIAAHKWPRNPTIGSILVTVGVFFEVTLSIFIARGAKRSEIESSQTISELNQETERLRKEAAEANLAQAKIEQRMKPRMVLGPESERFRPLLDSHAGKDLDIMVFDQHLPETMRFAWQFLSLFRSANWNVRIFEPIGAQHRIPGAPLVLAIGVDAPVELLNLAAALLDQFNELEIECSVSPNSFGEVGQLWNATNRASAFALVKEEPLSIMGRKCVSPFRIQIGALQLVPTPPGKMLIARIGPVTPPKHSPQK
ncbi:MAG TPA: hypothetical protein VH639_11225 [Bryobacteraceae bacterium]|jgi:hypothetical protein